MRSQDASRTPWLRPRAEPRLVLRFVTATALGLVVAGAAIVAIVNHAFAREAQRQANEHAQATVTTLATGELRRSDFRGAAPATRRHELRREIATAVGSGVAAQLYGLDGRLVLSVPATGTTPSGAQPTLIERALGGNVVSRVTSTPD